MLQVQSGEKLDSLCHILLCPNCCIHLLWYSTHFHTVSTIFSPPRLGAQLYPEAPPQVDAEDHPDPGDAAGRDACSPPQRLLPHLLLLLEHLLHHAYLLHGVAVDLLKHGGGHFHPKRKLVLVGAQHGEQAAG